MTMPIPKHLRDSGVQSPTIRHTWDDWQLAQVEEPLDDALVQRLARLSQRAILAFATGCAEWVAYRFALLDDDPAPWQFLEAAWAMQVHVRYSGYGKGTGWAEFAAPDDDDGDSVQARWTGPVQGPISRVLIVLESAIQELAWHGAEDPAAFSQYVARSAARIHKLAQHVMPSDVNTFDPWVATVLARLEASFPVVPGDELGDVVPREALDLESDFQIERTEMWVNNFLAHADRANPFLSDPPAMLEPIEDDADFIGTPYVFDLRADRAARQASAAGHVHGGAGHDH